jgi:hypothetical protein
MQAGSKPASGKAVFPPRMKDEIFVVMAGGETPPPTLGEFWERC